jgi:hypothetical protein
MSDSWQWLIRDLLKKYGQDIPEVPCMDILEQRLIELSEAQAENDLYRAEMSAAKAAGFYSAQELYSAYETLQATIERMEPVVEAANSLVDDWNDKYKQYVLWGRLKNVK